MVEKSKPVKLLRMFRIKSDMAEQVRRRQTKEAPLTKAQKDQIRMRSMIERDKYDL